MQTSTGVARIVKRRPRRVSSSRQAASRTFGTKGLRVALRSSRRARPTCSRNYPPPMLDRPGAVWRKKGSTAPRGCDPPEGLDPTPKLDRPVGSLIRNGRGCGIRSGLAHKKPHDLSHRVHT